MVRTKVSRIVQRLIVCTYTVHFNTNNAAKVSKTGLVAPFEVHCKLKIVLTLRERSLALEETCTAIVLGQAKKVNRSLDERKQENG